MRRSRAPPSPSPAQTPSTSHNRGPHIRRKDRHPGEVSHQPDQASRAWKARPPRVRVPPQRDCLAVRRIGRARGDHSGLGDRLDEERELRRLLGRPGQLYASRARAALHSRQPLSPQNPPRSRVLEVQPAGPLALHPYPRQLARPGRAVLLHLGAPAHPPWRVHLRRVPGRAHHRVHQRLQPPRQALPLDLRWPSANLDTRHPLFQ